MRRTTIAVELNLYRTIASFLSSNVSAAERIKYLANVPRDERDLWRAATIVADNVRAPVPPTPPSLGAKWTAHEHRRDHRARGNPVASISMMRSMMPTIAAKLPALGPATASHEPRGGGDAFASLVDRERADAPARSTDMTTASGTAEPGVGWSHLSLPQPSNGLEGFTLAADEPARVGPAYAPAADAHAPAIDARVPAGRGPGARATPTLPHPVDQRPEIATGTAALKHAVGAKAAWHPDKAYDALPSRTKRTVDIPLQTPLTQIEPAVCPTLCAPSIGADMKGIVDTQAIASSEENVGVGFGVGVARSENTLALVRTPAARNSPDTRWGDAPDARDIDKHAAQVDTSLTPPLPPLSTDDGELDDPDKYLRSVSPTTARISGSVRSGNGERPPATPVVAASSQTHLAPGSPITPAAQIVDALLSPVQDSDVAPAHTPSPTSKTPDASSGDVVRTLVVTLQPDALGPVQVRMRLVGKDLRVGIVAQTHDALAVLDASRIELSSRVADAGYQLSSLDIARSPSDPALAMSVGGGDWRDDTRNSTMDGRNDTSGRPTDDGKPRGDRQRDATWSDDDALRRDSNRVDDLRL